MATIIKTPTLQQTSGTELRAVAYDFTDIGAQAEAYLKSVRAEAAKIVEQARSEAAGVQKQAEEAGRKAAEQAIERILDEKVAKQMKSLTPALQAAASQIDDAKQDWLRHWESAVIELALGMAKRLVQGELARRPEISRDWLRQALELAAGSGEIVVRLNPTDQQTLERQVVQLAAAFGSTATVKVVADESISLGGCKIATEFGVIDNQLETQLERIREELT